MPTDFVFRLSTYLTLAVACATIGYAERDLFAEIPFIAAAVIIAMIVLFRLESRVELLSIPAANRLGLIVGLLNFGWLGIRLAMEIRNPALPHVEWQLLLIAMFGPLLMMLMAAKLARREKHVGDYWALHGAALAGVCLSGAIAELPFCFVLIGIYSLCAIWSLALFQIRRSSLLIPTIPGRPVPPPLAGLIDRGPPRAGFASALGVATLCVVVVLPLYLLTPRSPSTKLEFGKPRVEIGYSADQMIDLNQAGDLEENDQVAFEVTAERKGVPSTELSVEQRWRGRVFRQYSGGTWANGEFPLPALDLTPTAPEHWTAPQLSPEQLTLHFSIPPNLRGRFVADPVVWAADAPPPIATLADGAYHAWSWTGDGGFIWNYRRGDFETLRYAQVWDPTSDPDASPVFRILDADPTLRKRPLVLNPVPKVKDYADALLAKLVADGRLPAGYLDPISRLPRYEYHERIARAFTLHLATTPELSYTLNLRRERKDIDPIEEFLFHTKAGHCERFATTLALMLRSQGIPAVMVLGFKGCEMTDEAGKYVVRQSHAHAWVSALLPVAAQNHAAPARETLYRWVSLDATPASNEAALAKVEKGDGLWSQVRELFNAYIASYNSEKRRKALNGLWAWLTRWDVLVLLAAVGTGAVVLRRVARRARATRVVTVPDAVHRWILELLRVLDAHGLRPATGQTLREFATAAAAALRDKPATQAHVDVPKLWVEVYYEVRFGNAPLPPERLAVLRQRLAGLQLALSGLGDLA